RDRIPVLQVADKGVEDATIVKWLLRHRPDAVITMGDLRQLRGLDVGDPEYSSRLGVVLIGLAETDCGFTAVNENPYRIGMTAIDQLVTALNLNQRGLPDSPAITLIRGSWVEGDTLPTAREPV
ncbi:MAG: hypothetical protein PF795_09345, partial [Kiritimatiellae bacterium]|nr:hypothetical protein [Kiritimatiellia bacterium]